MNDCIRISVINILHVSVQSMTISIEEVKNRTESSNLENFVEV